MIRQEITKYISQEVLILQYFSQEVVAVVLVKAQKIFGNELWHDFDYAM